MSITASKSVTHGEEFASWDSLSCLDPRGIMGHSHPGAYLLLGGLYQSSCFNHRLHRFSLIFCPQIADKIHPASICEICGFSSCSPKFYMRPTPCAAPRRGAGQRESVTHRGWVSNQYSGASKGLAEFKLSQPAWLGLPNPSLWRRKTVLCEPRAVSSLGSAR
jgi:hypothetical protein